MPRQRKTRKLAPSAKPIPLLEVEEMLTSGWSRAKVVAACVEQHDVHQATAYKWIAKVLEKWAEESKDARPIRKAQLRAMYLRIYEAALGESPRQCAAAGSAVGAIAKLDGLNEPDEIREVEDDAIDLDALTVEELREYDRLCDKTEAARRAATAAGASRD